MRIIEVVINYICLNDQANGFCRYSPELTSRIEIDDPSWDGYTQLVVCQPKNAVLLVGRGAGEQRSGEAGEQGSGGAEEKSYTNSSPLPPSLSAPLPLPSPLPLCPPAPLLPRAKRCLHRTIFGSSLGINFYRV